MSIFKAWEQAKKYIEPSVPELHGTHTIDDIAIMIGAGSLTLWVGENCAVVTEIIPFPRMKVLNCFIGGGDLDGINKLRNTQIEPYARANGCSRIQGAGRKGWSRTLKDYEYGGIYMHKDL